MEAEEETGIRVFYMVLVLRAPRGHGEQQRLGTIWKEELDSLQRGQKAICEGPAPVSEVTPGLKESWREAEVWYQMEGSGSLKRGQGVKSGKGAISSAVEMPVLGTLPRRVAYVQLTWPEPAMHTGCAMVYLQYLAGTTTLPKV